MKNLCYMPQTIVACVGILLAWDAGTGNRALASAFTPHSSSLRKNMPPPPLPSLPLLSLSAERSSGKGSNSKAQVHASALDRRSVLLGTSSLPFLLQSMAVSAASAQDDSAVSPQDLLSRLRRVPCFAIVDKDGVPYMIVDKGTRGATGYFFLTFRGALTVLADAQKLAKEQGYEQIWADAKITAVPLDIALRLSLKKLERKGQNNVSLDTIVDILPGQQEREDALKLDKSGKFNEQGRVPLFYVSEGMLAEDGSVPVYFSKETLSEDWNSLYAGKDKPLPQVKVLDLLDLFESTMRGNGKINASFMPTQETMNVAAELQKRSLVVPYNTEKMVMVGGKS